MSQPNLYDGLGLAQLALLASVCVCCGFVLWVGRVCMCGCAHVDVGTCVCMWVALWLLPLCVVCCVFVGVVQDYTYHN